MATRTMTITKEFSFDDSITKLEVFDIDRMQWLLRSEKISKIDKLAIQKYYKRKQNINQVQVTYHLGEKCKTFDESGRLVVCRGGVGLQSFSREIRNFLAEKHYWDIDIVNAQPTLLWQYAKKEGWACENVQKYCETRDDVLASIQNEGLTRDEAKRRLIQLFFGSDYVDGLPAFIQDKLYPELKMIRKNMSQNNQKLYTKLSKRPNPCASVMAHILQTEEKNCMIEINNALSLKQRSLDVFMHDGGYVRKEKNEAFPTELLIHCQNYVREKLGYEIKIIQKQIESTIVMEEHDLLDESVLVNDKYAAEKFIEKMGEDICYDNQRLYTYSDGIWSQDEEALNTAIANQELVFKKMGGLNGVITYDYSGTVKNRENLKKMIPSVIEKKENFLEEGRVLSTGKLLFKNGIYDFKTNTLGPFDRKIVFSARIPFNLPTHDNSDIEFLNKTFFQDAFQDQDIPKVFRHFLMRGIIGDYRAKKFMLCIGPTNCSKGMLQEFLKNILGGNVGNFNCNSLIARQGTEGSRDLGWFCPLANTRLCFGSEINADKNSKINSELIKQIVSGGESIVLRKLFENEQTLVPRTMPILFVNEISSFTSMNDAIKNRLIPIEYHYSFVEFPTKEYQKQANPELKHSLNVQKYYDAFIRLMIREYQEWQNNHYENIPLPESMMDFQDDVIPTFDIEEALNGIFEITKNLEDYVPIKDLEIEIKNKGSELYKNKMTTMLKQAGCKAGRKYVDKRLCRVILGIKRTML